MVDVNVSLGNFSENGPEVEPANATNRAMFLDAPPTHFRIAFVSVDRNLATCPLNEASRLNDLLWKRKTASPRICCNRSPQITSLLGHNRIWQVGVRFSKTVVTWAATRKVFGSL